MGKPTASSLTLLVTRVQRDTAQQVARAARRIDQPMSAWLRIAIIEKLERDARRVEHARDGGWPVDAAP